MTARPSPPPALAAPLACASPEEPPATQHRSLSCLQVWVSASPSDHTLVCPLADSAPSFGAPPRHCRLQEASSSSSSVPSPCLPDWLLRTPRAGPGQFHLLLVQGLGTPGDGYVSGQSVPVQPAPLLTGCSRSTDSVSGSLSTHRAVTGASGASHIPHKAAMAISWLSAGATPSESGPLAAGLPQAGKPVILRTWWFFTD